MEYIYVGEFFHRNGKKLNLLEKKIGRTSDLSNRQIRLTPTKSPIGFTFVKAWKIGGSAKTKEVECQLHAILKHNQSYGEWFEDDGDDLVERVSKFMTCAGYKTADIAPEQDEGANQARAQVQRQLEQATLRENYGEKLIGVPFHYTYRGMLLTVTMNAVGEYFCKQTGNTYASMNAAFSLAGEELLGYRIPLNAWTGPRNDDSESPDQVIRNAAAQDGKVTQ